MNDRHMCKRAVIVEDTPQMRALIKVVLNQFGVAEIIEAENGVEAMAALKAGGADVIVMNWMMPGMDGIDPSIPIILATGVPCDSAETTALEAGGQPLH
jgi:two-component system, chemotaxis family, chemotaxis protein CheY